jgi:YHS domain-containing protein
MRLIITAILIYLLYKFSIKKEKGYHRENQSPNLEVGEMVQDPECKTYIPVDQAHIRVINGKRYYFCSEECAELFEKKLREGRGV